MNEVVLLLRFATEKSVSKIVHELEVVMYFSKAGFSVNWSSFSGGFLGVKMPSPLFIACIPENIVVLCLRTLVCP